MHLGVSQCSTIGSLLPGSGHPGGRPPLQQDRTVLICSSGNSDGWKSSLGALQTESLFQTRSWGDLPKVTNNLPQHIADLNLPNPSPALELLYHACHMVFHQNWLPFPLVKESHYGFRTWSVYYPFNITVMFLLVCKSRMVYSLRFLLINSHSRDGWVPGSIKLKTRRYRNGSNWF